MWANALTVVSHTIAGVAAVDVDLPQLPPLALARVTRNSLSKRRRPLQNIRDKGKWLSLHVEQKVLQLGGVAAVDRDL